MLSGIWIACGKGELGSGRWLKVALVGVGVPGSVDISSSLLSLARDPVVLRGLNVDAIARVDGRPTDRRRAKVCLAALLFSSAATVLYWR